MSSGLVLIDKFGSGVISDGTVRRALPRIPWNSVGSVLIARDGTIWTAGSEIGVVAYPVHGQARTYTVADGLDNNNVLALAESRDGSIWVGTISGLHRIAGGMVTHMISCANVTSIEPSADGSLWVGSDSGLIYVPGALRPIRIFTQRDGLPTSLIEGVAQDIEDHLWLGTEQGIVRVDKIGLLAPEHHPQNAPVVFGVGDGLRNAQSRINSVFRSRGGEIWFLTLEELGMIDPRRLQEVSLAPIIIDLVKIDDKDAFGASLNSLRVPAGRHRFTIRYTLPEFRIPDRIHFRYRLDGWDKSWIETGSLREATYNGIPPGHYTFRVDHSDGYGKWSSGGRTMKITIAPYFYQTGWFLTLVALLIASFIWQLHRFRVAQVSAGMDARMQERTRIARELHDTLLQGMIGASMRMYAASQQSFAPDAVAVILNRASQQLRELAEQSRQAVEDLRSSSPATDSLEEGLSRLLLSANLPDHIEPHVHIVGSRITLRPFVQVEIERIAREAVANALQHSGAGSIRLEITYQSSSLSVKIFDDGRGLDLGLEGYERHGHWGITGMTERARSIGGHLLLHRNEPRGTVVGISLPGSVAYQRPRGSYVISIWRRLLEGRRDR